MVYSTSRCPKCGRVIKRQTNPTHEIGNPFERCRWCGEVYLNSYKEEWITKSPIKRFFFYLQIGVWARAFLVPIFILIIPMAAFDMSTEIVWALWPIMSVVWLVSGYFIHKNANKEDIAKSIIRTSDPEYMTSLKKAGYTIYPINEHESYLNTSTPQKTSTQQSSANQNRKEELLRSLMGEESTNINKSTEKNNEEIKHICLSNEKDVPERKREGIYSEDIMLNANSSEIQEKIFSADIIADGLAELCIKQLLEVMSICHTHKVAYNEKNLVISTFSYFYVIWIFNYGNITLKQYDQIEEIYKNHFCNFNRKQFENSPFKEVLENETIFSEQLKHIDRRVRESYHAHNRTFVDDGISDEYILEFIENVNDKSTIKEEIAYKILKDWAYVAQEAAKQSSVKN